MGMAAGIVSTLALGAVVAGVGGGCGGPRAGAMAAAAELADAEGAPSVRRVRDLGDLAMLPARGDLPTDGGDGVAAIGELVWIEGDGFGRTPSVTIDGQPARVLARTGDGGAVCRVPTGVATGAIAVAVVTERGRTSGQLAVKRVALAVEPGAGVVHLLEVGAGGLASRGSLRIAGARDVAIAGDGQVGYVTVDPDGPGQLAGLAVVRLLARGGPELGSRRALDAPRAEAIAIAADAPIGALWGGGRLTVLDLGVPRAPEGLPGPPVTGDVVALAISPDGRRLAALRADGGLVPIALTDPARPRVGATLWPAGALPGGVRLRAGRFRPGGETLTLVVAPDGGPARLVEVPWPSDGAPGAGVGVDLAATGTPRALALGRAASGDREIAVLTTVLADAIAPGSPASATRELGGVAVLDPGGGARALGWPSAVPGPVAVTPDAGGALVALMRPLGDGKVGFAVAAVSLDADRPSTPDVVDLAVRGSGELGASAGLAIAP